MNKKIIYPLGLFIWMIFNLIAFDKLDGFSFLRSVLGLSFFLNVFSILWLMASWRDLKDE